MEAGRQLASNSGSTDIISNAENVRSQRNSGQVSLGTCGSSHTSHPAPYPKPLQRRVRAWLPFPAASRSHIKDLGQSLFWSSLGLFVLHSSLGLLPVSPLSPSQPPLSTPHGPVQSVSFQVPLAVFSLISTNKNFLLNHTMKQSHPQSILHVLLTLF